MGRPEHPDSTDKLTVKTERSPGTDFHQLKPGEAAVFDLGDVGLIGRSGAVWALDTVELNANLVMIGPGEMIDDHVNGEVDVVLIVDSGRGRLTIDGQAHEVREGHVAVIPATASRSIRAIDKLAYFSIHRRR